MTSLAELKKNELTADACGILPKLGHDREWLAIVMGCNRRIKSTVAIIM